MTPTTEQSFLLQNKEKKKIVKEQSQLMGVTVLFLYEKVSLLIASLCEMD